MLIVVNSMPKSGSTWFHNYVANCLGALGCPSAHDTLANTEVVLNPWANPGALDGRNLKVLLEAARKATFAIKTHVPPNAEILAALRDGIARMAFLIRHPADVVRSALAYGAACRSQGRDEPYAAFFHPRDAADFVAPFVDWAKAWILAAPQIVMRYEELFRGDDRLQRAVEQLYPATAEVSVKTLDQLRPETLSSLERDRLRVNLVMRPDLDEPTTGRCNAWAATLGYAAGSNLSSPQPGDCGIGDRRL